MNNFTFIDLFSGIGGFHQALKNLGGKCVFASDIDKYAIETYRENYGIDSNINVRDIKVEDIPKHDILCAGFPCTTFSKAGLRMGFEDKIRGTLFFEIVRILKHHKPSYLILENVRNLTTHDKGNTWKIIKECLKELDYIITEEPIIISPHQLGVPQLRERVVILGVHKSLGINEIRVEIPNIDKDTLNYLEILEEHVDSKYDISEHEEKVLKCWDEFIHCVKGNIGFGIWANEFSKDYSIDNFPKWKADIIIKNRLLYENNKEFIDNWLYRWNNLEDFNKLEKKLEWQCGDSCKSIWDGIIQIRQSGIRVKRPTVFPALVAVAQIPIIGKLKRRLTVREAARLQSFPDSFICNKNEHQAYKQFGNAVNVKVIEYMAKQLLKQKNQLLIFN